MWKSVMVRSRSMREDDCRIQVDASLKSVYHLMAAIRERRHVIVTLGHNVQRIKMIFAPRPFKQCTCIC